MSTETRKPEEKQINGQRHCYDSSGMHMFLIWGKYRHRAIARFLLSLSLWSDLTTRSIYVYVFILIFVLSLSSGMVIDDGNCQIRNRRVESLPVLCASFPSNVTFADRTRVKQRHHCHRLTRTCICIQNTNTSMKAREMFCWWLEVLSFDRHDQERCKMRKKKQTTELSIPYEMISSCVTSIRSTILISLPLSCWKLSREEISEKWKIKYTSSLRSTSDQYLLDETEQQHPYLERERDSISRIIFFSRFKDRREWMKDHQAFGRQMQKG